MQIWKFLSIIKIATKSVTTESKKIVVNVQNGS